MKTTPLITLLSSLFVLYGQPLAADGTSPAFPLKISDNRRHLVDQKGAPFLYQADTPWMLFLKLSEAEAKEYIARRKEQGFTALQVMLTGFLGMTNRAGELPFRWHTAGTGLRPAQREVLRARGLGCGRSPTAGNALGHRASMVRLLWRRVGRQGEG